LRASELAADSTLFSLGEFEKLFGESDSLGVETVVRATERLIPEAEVRGACPLLAREVLDAGGSSDPRPATPHSREGADDGPHRRPGPSRVRNVEIGDADAFFAHVADDVSSTVMGTHPPAGEYLSEAGACVPPARGSAPQYRLPPLTYNAARYTMSS
jgi:hypothetical protein